MTRAPVESSASIPSGVSMPHEGSTSSRGPRHPYRGASSRMSAPAGPAPSRPPASRPASSVPPVPAPRSLHVSSGCAPASTRCSGRIGRLHSTCTLPDAGVPPPIVDTGPTTSADESTTRHRRARRGPGECKVRTRTQDGRGSGGPPGGVLLARLGEEGRDFSIPRSDVDT